MDKLELIKLIEKYPEKNWDWNNISSNPNLPIDYIEKHPEKDWNWDYISFNPNFTMEDIEKYSEKPWNWSEISANPNVTMEYIEKYPKTLGIGIGFLEIQISQWNLLTNIQKSLGAGIIFP